MSKLNLSSQLEVSAIDDAERIIEGIATTPDMARDGWSLDMDGARFQLPMPLLWHHDLERPVGQVIEARPTPRGMFIRAQIAKIADPGAFRDQVEYAWHAVKSGLTRALSVGVFPAESTPMRQGRRATKWDWYELSLVTVPLDSAARIAVVRSNHNGENKMATTMGGSNLRVRLDELENERDRTIQRMTALTVNMSRERQAGRIEELTLLDRSEAEDAELKGLLNQVEEYDGCVQQLNQINSELSTVERSVAQSQRAFETQRNQIARQAQPLDIRTKRVELPKGVAFTRAICAKICSGIDGRDAASYARERWPDTPEVENLLRVAVAAGDSTTAAWAGALAPLRPMTDEFLELLRGKVLIDQLSGRLRRVPFNTSVPAQTGGGTYGWVGEGVAKPVTSNALATVTLTRAKTAGLIILTEELARLSSPDAETVVRDGMVQDIAAFLDGQFTGAAAAVTNVSPAGLLNGVTGATPSGTTAAAARADIIALLNAMAAAGYDLSEVFLIMRPQVAFVLGASINPLAQPLYPGLGVSGGSILGVQVYTSLNVSNNIIAVHGPSILYADDGGVNVDVSREASVQMDTAPDNPTLATTVLVSLWQRNLIGLRAERWITWVKARATAVASIAAPAYVGG